MSDIPATDSFTASQHTRSDTNDVIACCMSATFLGQICTPQFAGQLCKADQPIEENAPAPMTQKSGTIVHSIFVKRDSPILFNKFAPRIKRDSWSSAVVRLSSSLSSTIHPHSTCGVHKQRIGSRQPTCIEMCDTDTRFRSLSFFQPRRKKTKEVASSGAQSSVSLSHVNYKN